MSMLDKSDFQGGRRIKIAIVGAGISGLSVANGLLDDSAGRFDVQIYERDTIAFDSERGGYQIRLASNGLKGLRTVANDELWSALREVWAGNDPRAPAVVEPREFRVFLELSKFKWYPPSRPVSRKGLRQVLLKRPLAENRVHFDHRLMSFEHTKDGDGSLVLHFNHRQSTTADILIAADGSNSQVNRQVGLNNKVKLDSLLLLQSRGNIDGATRAKLPESLLRCGSLLFLGGLSGSGFASIYDPRMERPESKTANEKTWSLVWSLGIPSSVGESILAKADGDRDEIVRLVLVYLRRDLRYGEALPRIITAATTDLRTSRLTSSVKPVGDWREGSACSARIILLGDAVHPMSPGRGQGANQALMDAGKLVELVKNTYFSSISAIEMDLSVPVRNFDKDMYSRAFEMVKKSEAVTDVDLAMVSGKVMIRVLSGVMTLIGWWMLLLQFIGVKQQDKDDFESLA